jgi:hypothetical protein
MAERLNGGCRTLAAMTPYAAIAWGPGESALLMRINDRNLGELYVLVMPSGEVITAMLAS